MEIFDMIAPFFFIFISILSENVDKTVYGCYNLLGGCIAP